MIKRNYAFLFAIFLLMVTVLPVAAHDGENHSGSGLSSKWVVFITFGLTFVILLSLWAKVGKGLHLSQYGVIGLTLVTAVIHLLEGLNSLLLALNGLGYLALAAALYLPKPAILSRFRKEAYWAMIGYTLLTILLFFVVHPWGMEAGSFDKLGLGTKVIELLLVGLLFVELMSAGRQSFGQRWFSFQLPKSS